MKSIASLCVVCSLILVGCGDDAPECEYATDCADGFICDAGKCVEHPCQGTALACESLVPSTCEETPLCDAGGTCSGYPTPCGTFGNSVSCGAQLGCFWSSYDMECMTGSTAPCSTWSTQPYCEDISGCYWTPSCTAIYEVECSALFESECNSHPGCSL